MSAAQAFKIFIVEDNKWYGEMLEHHLSLNPDYEVVRFLSGMDCLKHLHQRPAAITLDYSLPDIRGDALFKKIKAFDPNLPVVIISGQEDISTVVKLLKEGVYDYIVKDEEAHEKIWNTLIRIREKRALEDELDQLKEEIGQKYDFSKVIKGNSPAIRKVFALMERAGRTNITVSVTGETGTGKEMVAKAIHYNSARKKGPFVAINVSAIPAELIESELFGHEKGAFTGAIARRTGKFELAHKGTLFLDEIGEMDINMQAKLLRVLQEREVVRVGGDQSIKVEVRVIVATHRNLAEEVKNGSFREDLYYRLLGLPIQLPPLRDRGNDILLLAKYFAREFCRENQLGSVTITPEALSRLQQYPFPGNVRELKAVMELAVVMSNDGVIGVDDISFTANHSLSDFLLEELPLKEYNRKIIHHFLEKYDRNVLHVAALLGIGKSKIYQMLKDNEV